MRRKKKDNLFALPKKAEPPSTVAKEDVMEFRMLVEKGMRLQESMANMQARLHLTQLELQSNELQRRSKWEALKAHYAFTDADSFDENTGAITRAESALTPPAAPGTVDAADAGPAD